MKRIFLLLFTASLLVACTGVPVNSDWDPGYNYAAIGSYAWVPAAKGNDADPWSRNDLVDARITAAVDAQLIARGWTKAASPAKADVLVNYFLGVKDKVDVQSFHRHFGYYPCFRCYHPHHFGHFHDHDVWVREYQQGTLMLDMVDPASKRLIWRGVSERRLPSFEHPEERRLYIVETVNAILAQFPPHKGR